MGDDTTKGLKGTIRVDEQQLQGHVSEVVRSSVEETLTAMLEAEADQLCRGAAAYFTGTFAFSSSNQFTIR